MLCSSNIVSSVSTPKRILPFSEIANADIGNNDDD